MKITKKILQDIIKEEIEKALLDEQITRSIAAVIKDTVETQGPGDAVISLALHVRELERKLGFG